jgi:DNA-directed RNA polymerase subunit RPC12/RpoP
MPTLPALPRVQDVRGEMEGAMGTYEEALREWQELIGEVDTYPELQQKEASYKGVRCKHCGRKNLHWGLVKGKWRLFAGPWLHHCEEYRVLHSERM